MSASWFVIGGARFGRPLVDRWSEKVEPSSGYGCWLWTGRVGSDGYGKLGFGPLGKSRSLRAHRLSYELNVGPIPAGLFVCHRCDNKLCVRPDHLFLGSHQDNMDDMRAKGRGIAGERHPFAALTWELVREIRAAAAAGCAQASLARKHGVGEQTISNIVRCRTWVERTG